MGIGGRLSAPEKAAAARMVGGSIQAVGGKSTPLGQWWRAHILDTRRRHPAMERQRRVGFRFLAAFGAELFVHDEERANAVEVVGALWPGEVEGQVADVRSLADVCNMGVALLIA